MEFQRNIRNGAAGNHTKSNDRDNEELRFEDRDVRTLEIQNRLVLRIRKSSMGRLLSEAWQGSESGEEEDDGDVGSGEEEDEEMENEDDEEEEEEEEEEKEDEEEEEEEEKEEGEEEEEDEEEDERLHPPEVGLSPTVRTESDDKVPPVLMETPIQDGGTGEKEAAHSDERHGCDSKEEDDEKEGRKDRGEMMEGVEEEDGLQPCKDFGTGEDSGKNEAEGSKTDGPRTEVKRINQVGLDDISRKKSKEEKMSDSDVVQSKSNSTREKEIEKDKVIPAKDNNNTNSSMKKNRKGNVEENKETNLEMETDGVHLTNETKESDNQNKDNCIEMDIDEPESTAKRKENVREEGNNNQGMNRLEEEKEKDEDKMETDIAIEAINGDKSDNMESALKDNTESAGPNDASVQNDIGSREENMEVDISVSKSTTFEEKINQCAKGKRTRGGDNFTGTTNMVVDPNEVGGTVSENKKSKRELPKSYSMSSKEAELPLSSVEKSVHVSIEESEVVNKINGELNNILETAQSFANSSIGGLNIAKEVQEEIYKMLEPCNSTTNIIAIEKCNAQVDSNTQIYISGTMVKEVGPQPMQEQEHKSVADGARKDCKVGTQKTADNSKVYSSQMVAKREDAKSNTLPKKSLKKNLQKEFKKGKSDTENKSCGVRGRSIQRVKMVKGDKGVIIREAKEGTNKTAKVNMAVDPIQVGLKESTIKAGEIGPKQERPKNSTEENMEIDPNNVGPNQGTQKPAKKNLGPNEGTKKATEVNGERGPKQEGTNDVTERATKVNMKMGPKQVGPKDETKKAAEVNVGTGPKQVGPKEGTVRATKVKDEKGVKQEGPNSRTMKTVEVDSQKVLKQGIAKEDIKKTSTVNGLKGPNQGVTKEETTKSAKTNLSNMECKNQQAVQAKLTKVAIISQYFTYSLDPLIPNAQIFNL